MKKYLLSIVFLLIVALPAAAYEYDENEWQFELTPYFLLAGVSGSTGIGPVESSVDFKAIDILKMAKFGGMFRFEAWKNKWRLFTDVQGLLLEDSDTRNGITAQTNLGQVIFEAGVGYEIFRTPSLKSGKYPAASFEVHLGGRYTFFDVDLSLDTGPSGSSTIDWGEPFGGGRLAFWLHPKVAVLVLGNIGGFSLSNSSDVTWKLWTDVRYRPWRLVSFGLGYMIIDLDYRSGNKKLDLRFQGPTIGATFHL